MKTPVTSTVLRTGWLDGIWMSAIADIKDACNITDPDFESKFENTNTDTFFDIARTEFEQKND